MGATAGVVNVTLSSPVTLSAKTYYILFRATAASATDHYTVSGNASSLANYKSDPYRGGMQHWWNGTAWTVDTDDDWFFTTNANANPQDDNGHGTHVSGIVGAKIDNGVGIAGVSYGARIMTIKAGSSNGSFRSSDIIEALNYAADNGAKVINMSFGGSTTSSLEQAAVNYAYGKGAALFAAAGNHLPTEDATTFNFPASYAHVVSVGATTNLDTRAGFSNVNATVDVSAPGENIYSTMPTYAVGLNSAGIAQDYDYLSGTSMATPMVAGLAALVLSRNPEYTAEQVMQVIETKLVDDKGPIAGWDPSFGTGRITGVNLANEVDVGNNRIDRMWWIPSPPPSSATTYGESLDSAGDRNDIFSVAVGEGQRVKVGMTAPAGTDFDLYLYPPGTTDAALSPGGSGGAVASSTGGTYKELSYMPAGGAGGTYYLGVNAASGRGSYVVTYSVMDADNDIPGVPAPPSPINDGLRFWFDENDVFSVTLADGQQIMTSLTGQATTDFDLHLYPPGSTDLSSSPVATSAGSGYPEKFKYVVPGGSGGTYYLRVAFTSGSFDGAYALTYTIGPADVTPPITTATLNPALPDGDNGWYVTAPTITLASNEAGVTYLQWETAWSGWWQTYTNPFGAYEGDNPLYYYSVDLSENQEATQVRSIKVDMSAPSAPTLLSASGDSSTAITLSWSAASDGVSGISGYRIYDGDSAALLASTSALSRQLTGVTPGVQKRYYVTAVDNAGHESSGSNMATIATVSAGTNVPVTVNSVTVSFSTVLSGGGVNVTSSTSPPAAQTGFQLNGVYYDVSSTVGFSGPVTVTLPYDPGSVVDPQALRLYHYSTTLSSWIDVTIGVDTVNHTVSGQVTSLSAFAAGLPQRVFRGFLRPLSTRGISVLKLGQTVPVKFRLRNARGNPVADAKARIYLAKVVNGVPGAEQPGTSSATSEVGNAFRYSATQDQYVFNLATKRLTSGVWQIRVMLDDGVSYVALIRLTGR
ncbi:MAG: S8 family serine peptidase [Thermoleophilia bacterium]